MGKRRGPTPKRGWQPLQLADTISGAGVRHADYTEHDRAYFNDRYSVFVRDFQNGAMHLSLHRHDRAAVRDWRHLQQIKNEVAGAHRTAIEVFPPEEHLFDTANEYHLWVLPEDFTLPFVVKSGKSLMQPEDLIRELGRTKARQRRWEPGLTTGLGS